MPVKVTLITDGDYNYDAEPGNGEQTFVVKSKRDYAAVGFAAARWARESIRNARMREGEDFAELRLAIDFLGESEPEPAEKPAKKARKKKAKANASDS
jgi:hypothetical protein